MEGRRQHVTLLHQYRLPIDPCEDPDLLAWTAQPGRADEDAAQPFEALGGPRVHLRGEGVDLGPVRVADGDDVEQLEGFDGPVLDLACQQDRSCAGTEHGHPGADALTKGAIEPEPGHSL